MEDTFRRVKGVVKTTVGYCGGQKVNPSYGDVCSGSTGHAETVEVDFDPAVVSYPELLRVFFGLHDPTTDNRRYHGGQYRSVIFYHTPQQQAQARQAIAELQKTLDAPVATEVVPEQKFWRAEEYHQQYYEKHHTSGACSR